MRITRMWGAATALAAVMMLGACAGDGPTAPDLASHTTVHAGVTQQRTVVAALTAQAEP